MRALKKRSQDSERRVEAFVESTATADHLDVVHETLARFWPVMGSTPDERWQLLFEIAVSEVAANILEHARPPTLTFRVKAVGDSVIAEFQDAGEGWDGPCGPASVVDDLAERGRGLTLASSAVDDMVYERAGSINRWMLVKRL